MTYVITLEHWFTQLRAKFLIRIMHNFHIPVMGLSFSIDTPLKIARYGISSAVSLGSDAIVEDMRAHYSQEYNLPYSSISVKDEDYRARRITAYLNLLDKVVGEQVENLRKEPLDKPGELVNYLELLPETSQLKTWYNEYQKSPDPKNRKIFDHLIRGGISTGAIDVNIMTKLNKSNMDKEGKPLPAEYSDALAALRGFANSTLHSSIVFSAGFNAHLYSYVEQFEDFFPDQTGFLKKKVILKVSDYRSAIIQGKFLAKKGIWISEFRIESGLNCGGHAFATEGLLLGPILKEFQTNREALAQELHELCSSAWKRKNQDYEGRPLPFKLTVQGGIGTHEEQQFLMGHYGLQSTGWGTPFLLVPEATNVDKDTLNKLIGANAYDLYLSKSSPLGVPFNNLRNSASESIRESRLKKGRPGSPCLKKYLVSNTEFTSKPICTASRQYQNLKLKELDKKDLPEKEYKKAYEDIVVKACLCEDLSATAYINHEIKPKIKPAPAICPGPNLAFFSRSYSLREMVHHIYGNISILNDEYRPHLFINELKMYMEYLENEWETAREDWNSRKEKYLHSFKANLEKGISYYEELSASISLPSFKTDLLRLSKQLQFMGN